MTEYTIDDIMKKIRPKSKSLNFPSYSKDNFMESEQVFTLLIEEVLSLTNKNIELEERVKIQENRSFMRYEGDK